MPVNDVVLEGASATADGHPSECGSVVSGSVQGTAPQSVSVNGTPIATVATADIVFGSHAHSYAGDPPVCTDYQSHSIDPSVVSQSIKVNGSPAYVKTSSPEGTDPGSGGDVEITSTGSNSSVTEQT